jgi:CRISPR system Cascade subunit CasD
MHTLLLRFAAPMQSWGVQSRFTVRDTGREPSKSGVVGLLCAALGRPRSEPVHDLAELIMGVRVDREGVVEMDFHTAKDVYKAHGGKPKKTEISRRYYLADAAFLVGLESENMDFLIKLQAALRNPHWPLYLGRKAFVPSPPIYLPDGLRKSEKLHEALETYPWLGHDELMYQKLKTKNKGRIKVIFDDNNGDQVRPDYPISFEDRKFAPRRITTTFIDWPPYQPIEM